MSKSMANFVTKNIKKVKPKVAIGVVVSVVAVWWLLNKLKPVGVTPGIKQSYTSAEYAAMAEVMYNSMYGLSNDPGAVDEIYERLEGVPGGFTRLSNAFGTRKYFWVGKGLVLGTQKDLSGWIRVELSGVRKQQWLDALRNN